MTFLALDVGNGSIKYARFEDGRRVDQGRLAHDGPLDSIGHATRAAAVSVHPPALERLRAAFPALEVVGEQLAAPLEVLYDPPSDCGPDRVMGVVGALHRRLEAPAVLVLDSGTCLTATLGVRGHGVLGGAIAPGVDLMARALAEGTQTLPAVVIERPAAFLGRSTAASIRSGVWAAFVGCARELAQRFRSEYGETFDVVATGTGGPALAAELEIPLIEYATLWGVYVAASGPDG
ncbi:MAG: type III pantothenate kinase [Planctomycetota bacterium]